MFRRSKKLCAILIVALAAVLLAAHMASACPTCKDGMDANDPEHAGMVQGYFYSILFMMAMPYTVFSAFALYMYREVKKARKRDAAAAQAKMSAGPGQSAPPMGTDRSQSEARELVQV
jgi:uncharacterized membrane protein